MVFAICDDEKIYRDTIIAALYDYFGKLELDCKEYESGDTLVKAYEQGEKIQALFLDIEMPGIDGLKTAEILRNKGLTSPILFLTSHTEMAMEGYEVSAFRFLSKTADVEKQRKAFADLEELLLGTNKLVVKCAGEDVIIDTADICYVEAQNNTVLIKTLDREYQVRRKITDIEKELISLSKTFVRVHRGYIVNLSYVKKHVGNDIILENGDIISLSRNMVNEFKKKLFEYVKNSAL